MKEITQEPGEIGRGGPPIFPQGEWDGPFCWPFGATHQAHLPPAGDSETGRLLMFPAIGPPQVPDDASTPATIWNPKEGCFGDFAPNTDCFVDVSNETTNLFCAGHSSLADGTILTGGGHRGTVDGADVGLDHTNHFVRDPFTGEWGTWVSGLPPMAFYRWYPTMTTLPDGRVIVVSGSDSQCDDGPNEGSPCTEVANNADSCGTCIAGENAGGICSQDEHCPGSMCDSVCEVFISAIPELYDPATSPVGWTQLTVGTEGMNVPFYPLNFVMPDGTLLYAGAEGHGGGSPGIPPTETWVLDLEADAPGNWSQQGSSSIPGGSAVMFEPGKVLKSGGGTPAVDGAAIYDAGSWTDVASMHTARRRHQLTMLPDGTVLATGGTRSAPAGLCVGGSDEGDACDPDNDDCTDGSCLALAARNNREYASSCASGARAGLECSTVAPLEPNCTICVGGADYGETCNTNADCEFNCRRNSDQGCPYDCLEGACVGGPMNGQSCQGDNDCGDTQSCIEGDRLWVSTAEIYDPAEDTWTEMAEAQHPRMYHSSTILLPDGRVVSAGGGPRNFGGAINSYPTVEFYSPPYYFKERPSISSAPDSICYDETFQVTSPEALDVTRVSLVRLGTTTHSFDSDQRFLELDIAGQGPNLLNVVAPENANVAPPGYYTLFVLIEDDDDEDVPSVGEYVQVVDCCIPTVTIPGSLNAEDTCVGDTSTETLFVCNTGCENLEVSSIQSSDPQFSATEPSSGYPVVISPDFCFPFEVSFTPASPGPQSAVLAVSSNDPTQPAVQVDAMGNADVPDGVAFIANSGDFGDVCLDEFKDLDLTIVNNGGCDLVITDIASDSAEFITPSSPPPNLVVGPGNSLVLPIRYQPDDLGPSSGTISITSNDPNMPILTIDVSGDTPPGDITVTGSTDFGDVCPEEQAEKVLDVCNVGSCNLLVESASIDCPDFTIINNPFPATVSPDFCMGLTIRFTPTSVGPKACTLTLTSDDPDTPVIELEVTGNTPVPMIDVPPDVAFAPTVLQEVDACETPEPFPVSNTGTCNLEIVELEISSNVEEYSLSGLPSFPIILEPGHLAGSGDLDTVFAPLILDRERQGEVSVTYVSDPIAGTTVTETRALCGESVKTGARVLVTHNGTPLDVVKMIKLRRVTGNNNQGPIDTVESAHDVELQAATPSLPCPSFQYHREYGTVSNPIQLLPGSYLLTVKAKIPGQSGFQQQTVGFDLSSCDFNPNITVDFQ